MEAALPTYIPYPNFGNHHEPQILTMVSNLETSPLRELLMKPISDLRLQFWGEWGIGRDNDAFKDFEWRKCIQTGTQGTLLALIIRGIG